MFHLTMSPEDRIHDLQATAAELRAARAATPDRRFRWPQRLRLRLGTILMAAGEALVSGVKPAPVSRVGR